MKPNLGDVLADKYRLDRVLGEGGMSTVFAATNMLTGKQVAIKWLQPELVRDEGQSQRLLREARAASAIDHPNVVNVFDVGCHDEALFLVMELLHGEPLSYLLARGPLHAVDFVRVMMPVLRGVHAAHRLSIVHRDLKPDNIFLCRDPHGATREAKVLDFGISKVAAHGLLSGRALTREGTVFGTPQYMAPEQMRDARLADARSDIYALGVIFYRAFSDEYPYDADTLTALTIRVIEGDAPPLHERCPELDPGLCDVIMCALTLDPAQRFQTVAGFARALEPYAGGVLFEPRAAEDAVASSRPRPLVVSAPAVSAPAVSAPPTYGASPRSAVSAPGANRPATVLDRGDVVVVEAEPTPRAYCAHSARPSLPRRSSPALEIVLEDSLATIRLTPRSSLRRTLLLAAGLFALGSLLPVGWQLWYTAHGASTISAIATKVGAARPATPSAPSSPETPAPALSPPLSGDAGAPMPSANRTGERVATPPLAGVEIPEAPRPKSAPEPRRRLGPAQRKAPVRTPSAPHRAPRAARREL